MNRLLAAQAQLKADLLRDPDPASWGTSVVNTTMPWQPVIDSDVLPGPPLERIADGSAEGVDVLVGTNVDDWRLWLVVSGAIGQITDEILTGPVQTSATSPWPPMASTGHGAGLVPPPVSHGRPR